MIRGTFGHDMGLRAVAARLMRGLGVFRIRGDVLAIESTGLFDRKGYVQRYPEVAAAGIDPVEDYLDGGALSGRNPCEFFDSAYYLQANPDVAAAGLNPLLHFSEHGWREARNPSEEFDLGWYASSYLEQAGGQVNPLVHYLSEGRAAGLQIRSVEDFGAGLIERAAVFDAEYYCAHYPDVVDNTLNPLVHYVQHGWKERRNPSALFDTSYYLENNPDVAASGENPLAHFCSVGWKELRNPSRDFDVWWYWSTHLDPMLDSHNPLGHYQQIGKAAGLSARPQQNARQSAGAGFRHPQGSTVRRICLLAGYDRDGIVDDYIISYVRELATYADVHYFADSDMPLEELAKLSPWVVSAGAERHAEYDFGSYSRLVRKLGWDHLASYDELLLVNDSCYLLRSLDEVFRQMDSRACDWWGLQATKGIAATAAVASNRFRHPIPMDVVKDSLVSAFESDYQYDFHVGSYFVAYRRPVISDAGFQKMLGSVTAQAQKKTLILKYEVGITRYLMAQGYVFDTYIDALYPFHPLFTNWYFQLLAKGFPLLKRYFLTENHYAVPALYKWKDRVLEVLPDADTGVIERHLARVVDPTRLFENLHIGTEYLTEDVPVSESLLGNEEFRAIDRVTPKYRNWWAFPVCAFTGVFSGNERALFEEIKDDPAIRKIVLTRGQPVDVDGVNVEVLGLESPEGQHRLMRAGNLFVKHSPTRNLVYPVSGELHNIINLWHGIPFKRIGYASADMQDILDAAGREHARCRSVIASSRADALAMAAAFYPLTLDDIWNTGLPRSDFILRDRELLPSDMQKLWADLDRVLAGRRLVLFMPTFRNAQEDAYHRFSDDEIAFLGDWLQRNDAVLGVREHMADEARIYYRQLSVLNCLDLSDVEFPHPEILYRASSALITDYSSVFIDYMLTGKPAVSFAYDHDRYLNLERGAFYDLDRVFPGPVCRGFSEFSDAMEHLFDPRSVEETLRLKWLRELFFDYVDDGSSARVAERVKQITDISGLGRSALRESVR